MQAIPVNLTLPQALANAAESRFGVHFTNQEGAEHFRSWSSILADALRISGALSAWGMRAGQRVAIVLPEPEEFVTAFLGAAVGGFVPVPMYPPVSVLQMEGYLSHARHILRASAARMVLTDAFTLRHLGEIQQECGSLTSITSVAEALKGPSGALIVPALEDEAFVQFTSGSTSRPKGVVLTHANLVANIALFGGGEGMRLDRETDMAVSWLPLFHDMGLIGMFLGALYYGGSIAVLPPGLFLRRPISWLKALTRHRGSVSFGTNFAYSLCTKRIREADLAGLDLSSWRVAGCGAEPIQPTTLDTFAKKFAAVGFRPEAFMPCYGMAEHTLAATMSSVGRGVQVDVVRRSVLADTQRAVACAPDDVDAQRFVACGRSLAGHELRIVDDHDRELPERSVGEVVARGPSIMQRYHVEEETRAALRGGWLRTGDLGYLADGELYICGRKKEVIIINGKNCYAPDLEWAVGEVDGVRKGNVVAFGLSSPDGRERVVIVAERRGTIDSAQLKEDILNHVRTLPGMLIDELVIVPSGTIPKTSSGKLKRTRTKALFEQGLLERAGKRPLRDQVAAVQSE